MSDSKENVDVLKMYGEDSTTWRYRRRRFPCRQVRSFFPAGSGEWKQLRR